MTESSKTLSQQWEPLLKVVAAGLKDPSIASHSLSAIPDGQCLLLQKFISWHRLGPLLLKGIQNSSVDESTLPKEFHSELKLEVANRVRHNLFLIQNLTQVYKAFEQNDICCLVLKGLPLAKQAYGEIGLRLGRDIDLLIHPSDYEKAATVLKQLNYQLEESSSGLMFERRAKYSNGEVWRCGSVLLDLHWGFHDHGVAFPLSVEEAVRSAESVVLAGVELRVLHKDMNLLYLVHHAAKHIWMRLFWVLDFLALSNCSKPPNWPEVLALAKKFKMCRKLWFTVCLAETLFGFKIPHELEPLKRTFPNTDAWLKRWQVFALQNQCHLDHAVLQIPPRRVIRWSLVMTDHGGDRILLGLRWLFQPANTDIATLTLPARLSWGYWVWRPIRLVLRAILRR